MKPRVHILQYVDGTHRSGYCGVSIYDGETKHAVIITELPDARGGALAPYVEGVAKKIHCAHLHGVAPECIHWMEHYPLRPANGSPSRPETFCMVELAVEKDLHGWSYKRAKTQVMSADEMHRFFKTVGRNMPCFSPPVFAPLKVILGGQLLDDMPFGLPESTNDHPLPEMRRG